MQPTITSCNRMAISNFTATAHNNIQTTVFAVWLMITTGSETLTHLIIFVISNTSNKILQIFVEHTIYVHFYAFERHGDFCF